MVDFYQTWGVAFWWGGVYLWQASGVVGTLVKLRGELPFIVINS
jgi:hypothetical protein